MRTSLYTENGKKGGEIMVSRKAIPKEIRLKVYDKYNHRCAYCGCKLEYKDMQVDHAKPLRVGGADDILNYMPACRSCNHYKATLDVEGFRIYLADIHKRLMRDSIPYQVAERFGIVKHMTNDVKFYFENVEIQDIGVYAGRLEVRKVRLIDADVFKEYIKNGFRDVTNLFKTEEYRDLARQITDAFCLDIDEQPTAYDVYKVVEQLEEASFYDSFVSEETKVIDFPKAIEIVKAGGL